MDSRLLLHLSSPIFRKQTRSYTLNTALAMEMKAETPTYLDAIRKLNSTQTRYTILEERRRLNPGLNNSAIDQMQKWIQRLGYTITDLDRLNIVHVAGTKGKGTTCAYVDSILQKYHQWCGVPRKVGLYTSPHLMTVRERIQINSEPISEELFTKYFFEVWNALESPVPSDGLDPAPKPAYFRFLTLMSFHVFMREGVDTAIYEVGVGGELDSTNVITKPAATGITTLGIDHVAVLGNTIDKIAWHKAGIFKSGCPAFTVEQVPRAMEVLKRRAIEKGAQLSIVQELSALRSVNIKPGEQFQRKNASLATVLACTVLEKLGIVTINVPNTLPEQFIQGLESLVWRGRCETLTIGRKYWYLDGAHTEESLEVASSWFGRISETRELPRVLIFNQQSTRDAISLLKTVYRTIYDKFGVKFQYALFCTNITQKGQSSNLEFVNKNIDPDALQQLTLQRELAATWQGLDSSTEVASLPSIEDAIDYVENIVGGGDVEKEAQIFVSGSFHLVGGALSILEKRKYTLERATPR